MSIKHLVEALVLVTGDSDLIPAMKLARREGIRVYLDSMGHPVRRAQGPRRSGAMSRLIQVQADGLAPPRERFRPELPPPYSRYRGRGTAKLPPEVPATSFRQGSAHVSAESIEPVTPHPPFITTPPARVLLATLEQGLGARAPFVLLTGASGTGKTMLIAEALRRAGDRVSLAELPSPAPEPDRLAATLLALFGGTAKSGANPHAVLDRLLNVLANATTHGRVAVLLVDDAHELTPEHFLELHRLAAAAANRQCALELMLVGLPELEEIFDEPELDALRPRVSVRVKLEPLSPNDTREYLQLRPNSAGGPSAGLFSRKASRDVYGASLGVIGTIEALAAESTRRAQRAGSPTVSPEHVRAAANALRAGRADDDAHTLPPRQQRPAEIIPLPRPAAASPETTAVPTPARIRPGVMPDFPTSSDERVKEWVARFGGSGVRIGARTVPRSFAEPERFEETSIVVTKRTRTPAEEPGAAEVFEPTPAPEPVEPEPVEEAPVVEIARVEKPVAPVAKRAEVAKPAKSKPVAKPRKLIVLDETLDIPPMPSARSIAPPAPARRAAFKPPAPMMWVALGVAVLALAISQRGLLGKFTSVAFTKPPAAVVAPAPVVEPTPAPVTPAPAPTTSAAQWAIAVGSFPTRDMAHAEADYMGRLVPLRVKVAQAGPGARGYRLLLGKFDSAAAAEQSMRKLQGRGLIPEAKAVELPSATNGSSGETATPAPRHRRHSRR